MRPLATFTQDRVKLALSSGFLFGLAPGTDRFVTKIARWHSGAKMRRNSTARMQQHGNFTEPGYRDARYPSVSGHYVAPGRRQAQEFVDEINAYLGDGGEGVLEVTDADGDTRWANVLLIGCDVRWNGDRDVAFDLDMEAPDPRKYGQPTTASTGVAREAGGLVFDLFGGAPLVERRRNLHPDPAATSVASFGTANGGSLSSVASGVAGVGNGVTCVRYTFSTFASESGVILRNGQTIADGQTLTASVWVKTATTGVRLSAQGSGMARRDGAGHAGDNAWQRLSVTFTAAAGGNGYVLYLLKAGATAGQTADFTGILLENGPTVLDYFDGTSAPPAGFVNSWAGAPNASASIQSEQTGAEGVLDFGPAGALGTITLRNPGKAEVYPTFQVQGYTPGFTIVERETQRRLVYEGLVGPGQNLYLDGADGSVKLEGYSDRLVNLVRSEWPSIPGGSSRTYLYESVNGPDSKLIGTVVPAWW